MKNYLKAIAVILTVLSIASCSKKDDDPVVAITCDSSTSDMQALFGTGGTFTYDFDVHSYTFTVSKNKTVCKIGYQSTTANAANLYKIKIFENGTNIFEGSYTFNSLATSYITPTAPINLLVGNTYRIEREQLINLPLVTDIVGRVKNQTFPVTTGDMTILSSKFFFISTNGTSEINNTKIPFIDLIFQ